MATHHLFSSLCFPTVILVNPFGLPKLSFLNFAKALIALLCGGSGAEALNKAFGIATVLKILEFLGGVSISTILGILLSPLLLLERLKLISWAPKIGQILGKISKLVRPAYRKMDYLEKEADDKCEESGVVLNFINRFFAVRHVHSPLSYMYDSIRNKKVLGLN